MPGNPQKPSPLGVRTPGKMSSGHFPVRTGRLGPWEGAPKGRKRSSPVPIGNGHMSGTGLPRRRCAPPRNDIVRYYSLICHCEEPARATWQSVFPNDEIRSCFLHVIARSGATWQSVPQKPSPVGVRTPGKMSSGHFPVRTGRLGPWEVPRRDGRGPHPFRPAPLPRSVCTSNPGDLFSLAWRRAS